MKKWFAFVLVGIMLAIGCSGSRSASTPEQQGSNYGDCLELYRNGQYQEALQCMNTIPRDLRDFEYFDLRGTLQEKNGDLAGAIQSLTMSTQLDSCTTNSFVFYKLGEALWKSHDYLQAGKAFEKFNRLAPSPKSSIQNKVLYFIRSDSMAQLLYNRPKEYHSKRLSDSINTADAELGITMTLDNKNRIITRRSTQEDLFQSKKDHGNWSPFSSISSINTPYNEGAAALSGDGQTLVFAGCNYPRTQSGMGSCDIFITTRNGEDWNIPKPLSNINSIYWDSQPTLSVNGNAIIFSSERKGGYGNKDLWISVKNTSGTWTEPINLGPRINTPGNEENPFIHTDERTLYFTSDYHPGLGGRDLFYSHRLKGNNWTTPTNLGYPVNSFENEEGIFVDPAGETGYFASEKNGNFDIYSFEMDSSNRPSSILNFEFVLRDKKSGSNIENAQIQFTELNSGKILKQTHSNEEGIVRFLLFNDSSYSINIEKEGYQFLSKNITPHSMGKLVSRDTLYLYKLKVSKDPIVLENIFFSTGSTALQPASNHELMNLTNYLIKNPEIRIHIMGHTDNIGSEKDNMELSQGRANTVMEFLVNQGISPDRLQATGYGESRPLVSNDTPEGRAKNRRTEFTIE
ncbi:OmpA family protein [Membranihabitans maritimus]|uniref:OmpA family protein n=1 Tax=Membranihabitans maritimus TaxID=2904244 RepID=UPI001F192639|nr:OmpA family protein [Membranihabitans maritimus]